MDWGDSDGELTPSLVSVRLRDWPFAALVTTIRAEEFGFRLSGGRITLPLAFRVVVVPSGFLTLIVPPAIFFLDFFSPSFPFSLASICTIRLSHTIQYTSKGASSACALNCVTLDGGWAMRNGSTTDMTYGGILDVDMYMNRNACNGSKHVTRRY